MDLKTIRAVLSATCKLSSNACFVMVALASLKFNEGSECKATVAELSAMCKLSNRTIKYAIAELKKAGAITVRKEGKQCVYKFGELSTMGANFAPVDGVKGANFAPKGGEWVQTLHHKGANFAPIGDGIYRIEKKKVCEKPAYAHTRTRAHARGVILTFDKLTESCTIEAGSRAGVPADVSRQIFAELKANGGGYISRGGTFVKVTSENLQAAIRVMCKHVKPTAPAAKPTQAKKPTAKEIENAQVLCAERCAMFRGGKCCAGVAVLPAIAEHKHPPEDCLKFHAKKTKGSAT